MSEKDVADYHINEFEKWVSLTAVSPHWDDMAVFSANLDESGTHDGSPLTVVGGVIFSERNCSLMEREWRKVLIRYGVKIFRTSLCKAHKGEFKGWEDEKCRSLILELANIVSSYAFYVIAIGVNPADFHAVWKELNFKKADRADDAYRTLLELSLNRLGSMAKDLPVGDKMAIFVEKGNKRSTFVNDLYMKINGIPDMKELFRIDQISFVGKEHIPLQAADLVVNEIYQYHPNLGTNVIGDTLRELTKDQERCWIGLYRIDELRKILRFLQISRGTFKK